MTKQKMVRQIARKTHQYESVVSDVIDLYIDICKKQLLEEGAVLMRNFVKLDIRERKPKWSRNPQTGKIEYRKARKYVKATGSRSFNREINGVFDEETEDGGEET